MADGSQTIDRLQVVITTNLEQLRQELQEANAQVDNTKAKLGNLESSANKAGDGFGNLADGASSSRDAFERYNDSADNVKNTFGKISTSTGKTIDSMDKLTLSTVKTADGIEWVGTTMEQAGDGVDWIPDAASQMGKLSEKTQGLGDKAKNAASMIKGLKGGLAALGITAGITAIINKLKEMADNAIKARDAYNETKSALISYTGELDDTQLQMVNDIYVRSATSTGFADKDQVTKAVGSAATLFKDATPDQTKEIATKLSTFQALGRVSDTAAYANTAKEAFTEWGIGADQAASSMEYLYYVSQQTGADLSKLTQFMADNGATFKELGYSFEESAQMIGNTSYMYGGNLSKLSDNFTQFEQVYDDKLDELTKGWEDTHKDMKMPDWVLEEFKDEAKTWAIEQAKAYGEELPNAIKDAQSKAMSSGAAYDLAVNRDTKLMDEINEGSKQVRSVTNPVNAFELNNNYDEEVKKIKDVLQKDYGIDAFSFFNMDWQPYAQMLKSNYVGTKDEGMGLTYDEVLAKIREDKGEPINIPAQLSLEGSEEGTATENAVKNQLGIEEPVEVAVKLVPEGESGKKDDGGKGSSGEFNIGKVDTGGSKKSDKKDEGSGLEVLADLDLSDAGKDIENMGNATEGAMPQIQTFTNEAVTPLLTATQSESLAIQAVIDVSMLSNDYSVNTTVPTLQSEQTTVNALEQAYWALYRAKLAAASV